MDAHTIAMNTRSSQTSVSGRGQRRPALSADRLVPSRGLVARMLILVSLPCTSSMVDVVHQRTDGCDPFSVHHAPETVV